MQCYVYKGHKKADHFLFLDREIDVQTPPNVIPKGLLILLGELEFVVDFDLDENRSLAQADPIEVLSGIQNQGFYLQMPNKDMAAEEAAYFN